jgi:2-(3-amino-3-carboxypropyl)histidine synthase
MIFGSYDIDINQLISIIKKNSYNHILLYLPDGLKIYSMNLSNEIKKKVLVDIYISGDPCFGACDYPPLKEITLLGIDAVIQIGHTPIPNLEKKITDLPFIFIPAYASYPIKNLLKKVKSKLIGKTIMVVTTAQHVHQIHEIASFLKSNNFYPLITEGDKRIHTPGQVLGCNYSVLRSNDKPYDSILFIGSGLFHPIGLLLSTSKPVIIADPYTGTIQRDELFDIKEKLLRKRYAAIALTKNYMTFGILISTKPGQQQKNKAIECRNILKKHGKQSYFIVLNHISPYALENFSQIECFVSTACPRIVIDDATNYKKPLITPVELKIAFNQIPIERYQFDEINEDF